MSSSQTALTRVKMTCSGGGQRKALLSNCTKQFDCAGVVAQCHRRCRVRYQPNCVPWPTFRDRFAVFALIVVNFIFLVCGGVLLVLGFLLYLDKESSIYIDLISRLPSTGPLVVLEKLPAIFMTVGISVVIVSFLGCYGTCAESVCFLSLYTILILCILSTEMIFGSILFIFRQKILHNLETNMQHQIKYEYNKTAALINETDPVTCQITSIWDTMQIKLQCCGAVGPEDFRFSAWYNHTRVRDGVFVPPSCCRLWNDYDPSRPSGSLDENKCQIDAILYLLSNVDKPTASLALSTQGCSDSAVEWISSNAVTIVTLLTFLAILQITHFSFACSVLTRLRRSYNDYQWYEDHVFG